MTIYISGGSNSLKKDGWVPKLHEVLGSQTDLRNISIGGAPSQMGAYRSLFSISMEAGDTVLWEYAINDELHIDLRGYEVDTLLNGVEWLLRGCHQRGIKFAAMVFRTRRRHLRPTDCTYTEKLAALFRRYDVPVFDVNAEFAIRRPRKDGVQASHYSDNAHYDTEKSIMKMIVKGAVEMVEQARVPADGGPGTDLVVYDRFEGGEQSRFENSAGAFEVWKPGESGMSVQFDEAGTVVGLVLLSTTKGGVIDVSLNGSSARISLAFKEKNYDKPMMKFISLPTLTGQPLTFEAGDSFRIDWADTAEGALADLKFNANPGPRVVSGREARIAALLVQSAPTAEVSSASAPRGGLVNRLLGKTARP